MKKIILLLILVTNIHCLCAELIKPWTVLIYIAGDNDLEIFIDGNVNSMARIGSNDNCTIIVCIARREGSKRVKKLKYILVEKNKQKVLFEQTAPSLTDSGQEETLRNFCTYAIKNFPAHNYGIIFWDHGTGPLDPSHNYRRALPDNFSLPSNRFATSLATLPLLALMQRPYDFHKAVCFDDSTGNYLTEKKLLNALSNICNTLLGGRKFAVIGFDTCLMANVEIASLLKNYGEYMVSSQEVEPGTGWNYEKVFSIFTNKIPTPLEFGKHIVKSYKKQYFFADDLTLSCVDLEQYNTVENNLKELIHFLQQAHLHMGDVFIKSLLKTSAHKKNCTHFDEHEYIDVTHFLENLLYNFKKGSINKGDPEYTTLLHHAEILINKTLTSLQRAIVANTAGKDFVKATGLSIYFPANNVNKLYKKNVFCCATQWAQLLQSCL